MAIKILFIEGVWVKSIVNWWVERIYSLKNIHENIVHNKWVVVGAILMALSVGLGAFGAHGLKNLVDGYALDIYKTGVQYQFYHALGILLVALIFRNYEEAIAKPIALFLVGIVLFSGSLYLLAIRDLLSVKVAWVGPLTPLGGLCFIVGWILVAYFAVKKNKKGD